MSCKLNQDLMDAYLDGEVDLVRSLEIEHHLQECPSCAHAYEQRRSFVTALKSAPLYYAAPAALAKEVRTVIRKTSGDKPRIAGLTMAWPRQNFWWYEVATGVAMAAGLLVVLRVNSPSLDDRLGQDVVSAHVRSLMANHLTDVQSTNHHVVKPWFNGRLDFSPTVRDFSDHGFPLAGGRLDYLNGRSAAAIVYYRAAHPINLFVWPSKPGETQKIKSFTRQGYHLLRWSEGGMTYWAISDVNEHDLQDFAELIKK